MPSFPHSLPVLLLTVPVLSTLAGGLLAMRFWRFRHLLLATGAGLLLGAAFLDLLPEAIGLSAAGSITSSQLLTFTLLSFLVFAIVEMALDSLARSGASSRSVGRIGGGLLIFHSFRDGMAIGAAFAVQHPAGYAVALGIAAHDIGDGMNTVLLTTGGERPGFTDYLFLVTDAVAPFVGGLAALRWFSSARSSVILLAIASGFFIQMAASDFLPEARRSTTPRRNVILCMLGGVAIIYVANLLLGSLT